MAIDWRDAPRKRVHFYRDKYRSIMTVFMLEVLVMLILVGIVIYLLLAPVNKHFYASTTGGQIFAMTLA